MFSVRENAILKIIGKKQNTVKSITEDLFKDGTFPRPFDAEISVTNSLRRIVEKCEHYGLSWTLKRVTKGRTLIITKENRSE